MSTTASLLQAALMNHQAGRLDAAELGYVQLLQIDPDHSDALYLLGLVAHQSRRHADAVALVQRAIELQPHAWTFHNTLGDAYRLLGRPDEAERALRRAHELAPNARDVTINLALVLHAQGQLMDALPVAMNALASFASQEPWPPTLRTIAVDAIRRGARVDATPDAHAVLLRMCNDTEVATSAISDAVLSLIRQSPAFAEFERSELENARSRAEVAGTSTFTDAIAALVVNPLLLAILPRIAIADEQFERVLITLRRALLQAAVRHGSVAVSRSTGAVPFAAALAQQCFNTEYAWTVSDEEREALSQVTRPFAPESELNDATGAARELSLSIMASYAPLADCADANQIVAQSIGTWSVSFRPVVTQQLVEPAIEAELAAALPSLTLVSDSVSQVVRDMYEHNPYPRWIDLERPGVVDAEQFIETLTGRALQRTSTRRSILVAGCGTGRQPIQVALQFADSDVLAIDLSRASLGYAAREAFEYQVLNLTFAHADLLELDLPQRAFTIISCSGVLHHLADPLVGWRRLLRLLAPGGVMKIGLYSTIARRSIEAARVFVVENGFASAADDIRRCRQAILALPVDHPVRQVTRFPDFFSISGCRDLIMHVQERTYTTLELAAALDELGLRFLGFQTDGTTQARFATMFPSRDAATDLASWHTFENAHPDTFGGMYQLWCDRRLR